MRTVQPIIRDSRPDRAPSEEVSRDTGCAWAWTRIAAVAVSRGKNESRAEYAAPLAVPKQLSWYARTNDRLNSHQKFRQPRVTPSVYCLPAQ